MRAWGGSVLLCWAAHAAEDLEESGGGCRYFHREACEREPFPAFFEEWRKKTDCWLCNNQELVLKSKDVLKDFLYTERPEIPVLGQELELHDIWKETCLAGFLLALFSTTRSQSVQPWKFYDVGLSLINSCAYDEAKFFARYGITTAQVAYNFYILGLPYHLPDPVLHLQASETSTWSSLQALEAAPLVIDIGMGLGADSRYYLSQGFRVVAVEANRKAIEVAMSIDWVQPLVLEGRLTFLHAFASGFMVEKDPQCAFILGSATSGVLTAGMLPRFLSSKKMMPTGMVSLIGLMAFAYNCMQLNKWWDPEELPFLKAK